ncbi:MAG: glycosyltransferase [Candidatus Omnitrophota bacterium]|jgi:glycosyltransferase involved in cell wall biosynthesis|nr:MAG: glycosyltransferase [Candidatus Omnitrophota bacterium]
MRTRTPKISVIIPTYNRANYISVAIHSVLNQTYHNWEIIVIDDGSNDSTKEVIRPYLDNISYFYQNNQGEASARNIGINRSKGEFIAFLDSDDLWLPDKLKIQISRLESNDQLSLTYCRAKMIDSHGIFMGYKPTTPALSTRDFLYGARLPMTVLVKRKVFDEVGLFDTNIKVGVDTDLWLRLSMDHKIDYLDEPLAVIRAHNDNISIDKKSMYLGSINTLNKLISNKIVNNFDKRELNNLLAKQYYLLARECNYTYRERKSAFSYCFSALNLNPSVGKMLINKKDDNLLKYKKLLNPYFFLFYTFFTRLLSTNKLIKQSINILFYDPSSGYGGSGKSLSLLINNLNEMNFSSFVLIKNFGPQFTNIKNAKIVKIKNTPNPRRQNIIAFFGYIIPEAIRIFFILKLNNIRIVHVNTNILSGLAPIIAARIAGVPCICHIRLSRNLIKREILFSYWIDHVIVLNINTFKMYRKYFLEERISLIYDGLSMDNENLNNTNAIARCEFCYNSEFCVGIIGRIVEGKGHKEFILMAQKILEKNKAVKFLIVGEPKGDYEDYFIQVVKLVKERNLSDKVIFTGWRNDINNIISGLDVLVQASTTFPEGFGLTIIEAMAMGKVVVATNIPGPSDIIVNGETGFLVPPGDINLMADKILYLLCNPDVARKMGEAGRNRVEKFFAIKNTVKSIEEIYMGVLLRKRQR